MTRSLIVSIRKECELKIIVSVVEKLKDILFGNLSVGIDHREKEVRDQVCKAVNVDSPSSKHTLN